MKKVSAGLLLYRNQNGLIEVLLGHPGGPFWAKKDLGAWSIPKGECGADELPLDAAKREFCEEVGQAAPQGEYVELGTATYGNKTVHAWAVSASLQIVGSGKSTFEMEWPPKSGKMQQFLEIDRIEWFPLSVAVAKINQGQALFLQRLAEHLGARIDAPASEQSSLF